MTKQRRRSLPSDRALLEAWQAGDESSGKELIRRHQPSIAKFLRRRVPTREVDLMQDVWLACVDSLNRIPSHIPFRVYLFGIARRTLYKHYRIERKLAVETRDSEMRGDLPSPSQVLAGRDSPRFLEQAFQQLPTAMVRTLKLFYWQRLSVAEVATVLGVSPGTVKSRLHRSRVLLLEQLRRWRADISLTAPPALQYLKSQERQCLEAK